MELYTVTEVSKKLKVNKNYVYTLISKGLLKSVKLGKIKVPSVELEKFILDSIGKDFTDLDNIKEL